MGTAHTQKQSILGVLLRAIYSHVIIIIQLLLGGGSIQGLGFRASALVSAAERLGAVFQTYREGALHMGLSQKKRLLSL